MLERPSPSPPPPYPLQVNYLYHSTTLPLYYWFLWTSERAPECPWQGRMEKIPQKKYGIR